MAATPKKSASEKPLTAVMEDYLEAIFDLSQDKKVVRVKDIAKRMDVKMPTVSSMLKTLNDRGLVHYEKYEYIDLTKSGRQVGKEMRRRHGVLNRFLTEVLQIDAKNADEEACKMEHALSSDTLDSLVSFMEFIQACPRTGDGWLEHFEEYRRNGGAHAEKCRMQSEIFTSAFQNKICKMGAKRS